MSAQQSEPTQTWPGRAFGNNLLQGKVAVVTGAARGIGRSIAVDMAANGADVIGIDICAKILPVQEYPITTPGDLDQTGTLVRQTGRKWTQFIGDIRDLSFLRATADQVEQQSGSVDILVANAGTQLFKPLLEMEDWQWHDVINNNLNGTANTIRAFAPKIVKGNKGGRIIVISSMQGKHGAKNMASYGASKWGLIGLTKTVALELGKYKITANVICPGLIDTALTRNESRWRAAIGEANATDNPPQHPTEQQTWDARAPRVPLKVAWLKPEDIAPAAVFLASDLAAMVTGACYDVTAGDDASNMS
jgi:NAD(P)-dependent dehydrogenase (short-subunit alcohol dehydrogenase family)